MQNLLTPRVRAAMAALIVAIAAALAIVLTGGDDPAPPPPTAATITVTTPAAPPATAVDGPDADRKRDDALTLDAAAQAELERATELPAQKGAEGDLEAGTLREKGDGKAGVLEGPLAAQEFTGCRTRFVQNFSSRNGTRPQIIVWHQTVSRDRPGYSDQDALTALANTRSSGVSWHFLVGRKDGLCTFTVPLNLKAWTQGNANPFSIGIEVQAYGDEPRYVEPAGERKLIAITRELGKIYGIPMRRGRVVDCKPVRSGIVEHSELGTCGGGHADVTPWDTAPLIAKAADAARPMTSVDKLTCRKLTWWRENGRPRGGLAERNAVRRRTALDRRGVTCTPKGPVRR